MLLWIRGSRSESRKRLPRLLQRRRQQRLQGRQRRVVEIRRVHRRVRDVSRRPGPDRDQASHHPVRVARDLWVRGLPADQFGQV